MYSTNYKKEKILSTKLSVIWNICITLWKFVSTVQTIDFLTFFVLVYKEYFK